MIRLAYAPLSLALSLTLAMPTVAWAAPAPTPPGDPASMTPEQRLDRAKVLFGEGKQALDAADHVTALAKFEEAYNVYAPDKHLFNYNIGLAAYGTGDCVKAKTAFQRFLDLVPENPARGDAQQKLLEIERSGCANVAAPVTSGGTTTGTTTTLPVEDEDDAPVLTSRREEREEAVEEERERTDARKAGPMMISGAILTAVGAAGVIGGVVSLVLANKKAKDLAALASPGPTGFPEGNYADDSTFDLDRNKLPANNTATIVLFAVGGALLVTGIALLAVDGSRKKKQRAKLNASVDTGGRRFMVAPTWMRGGGGASATVKF